MIFAELLYRVGGLLRALLGVVTNGLGALLDAATDLRCTFASVFGSRLRTFLGVLSRRLCTLLGVLGCGLGALLSIFGSDFGSVPGFLGRHLGILASGFGA